MFINTRSSIMSSTMRPEGSLRWEPYTVILESQLTRPDVGGLHRDHDHHRRGDQWHGGDQGRSCGIEQETSVSSSGELLNKGTHQIWNRDRTHNFSVKPNHFNRQCIVTQNNSFQPKRRLCGLSLQRSSPLFLLQKGWRGWRWHEGDGPAWLWQGKAAQQGGPGCQGHRPVCPWVEDCQHLESTSTWSLRSEHLPPLWKLGPGRFPTRARSSKSSAESCQSCPSRDSKTGRKLFLDCLPYNLSQVKKWVLELGSSNSSAN